MTTTKIAWVKNPDQSKGRVWNPTVGCSHASTGCINCYAETMAKRLKAMGRPEYQNVIGENGKWTGRVETIGSRVNLPMFWTKPTHVFVDSMTDLFHPDVPFDFILQVWITMAICNQHTFMILTKRPDRMKSFVNDWLPSRTTILPLNETLKNLWLGVSTENQDTANVRVPLLQDTHAALRFISAEPLLSEIDLYKAAGLPGDRAPQFSWLKARSISWVIVGCESGPEHRHMDINWVRLLRNQTHNADAKFFFKQKFENDKLVREPILDDKQWAEIPEGVK